MTGDRPYEGPICDRRSFGWALSDREVDVVYRRESMTGRELYEAVYIEGDGQPWGDLSSDVRKFYTQRAKVLSFDPDVRRQVEDLGVEKETLDEATRLLADKLAAEDEKKDG